MFEHGGPLLFEQWRIIRDDQLARLTIEDVAYPRRVALRAAEGYVL